MVGRLRKDVFANSQVGGFVFHRDADRADDWNRVVGADGSFNLFQQRLSLSGFVMRTQAPTIAGAHFATSLQANYQDPFLQVSSAYVGIDDDFLNDFGFVPRHGINKYVNMVGVTPRFSGFVLENNTRLMLRHTLDTSHHFVSRFNALGNIVTFRDGASLAMFRNMMFERLDEPFEIQGRTIAPGDYRFNDWNFRLMSSRARRFFGNAGFRVGGFYDGDKKEVTLGAGLRYSAAFQASVDWSRNIVDFAGGGFTTDLIALRADAAFSPKMFLQGLLQYNTASETISTNVTYRMIHHPLSDFYVVYNEVRDTTGDGDTQRVFSVKVTHLVSF